LGESTEMNMWTQRTGNAEKGEFGETWVRKGRFHVLSGGSWGKTTKSFWGGWSTKGKTKSEVDRV